MTSSGTEPATFRRVVYYLNQLRYRVPINCLIGILHNNLSIYIRTSTSQQSAPQREPARFYTELLYSHVLLTSFILLYCFITTFNLLNSVNSDVISMTLPSTRHIDLQ
jgi:hypothetical protein